MPILRVARGRSTAEEFPFEDSILIGRAVDCDVRVFDEAASRRHAEIRREGTAFVARDLGSSNGTYVNGRRVDRAVLRAGDEVAVRGLTLVFYPEGVPDKDTVIRESSLAVEARVSVKEARVSGREEDLLGRLASLYRFTGALAKGAGRRRREEVVKILEETFRPCRAALVLPDAQVGSFSRTVVEHARRTLEGVVVREPEVELPRADSILRGKVKSAMAAPLGNFGVLYADRSEGESFSADDLKLLCAMANAAAPAMAPRDLPGVSAPQAAEAILGESAPVRALREEIRRVGPTDATVLVTGETGTGKELVARALHAASARAAGPFVAVNCAAFPEGLLEAELFGHEKGAFTGADRARPGRFELAHKGTLFLDEVGDLRPDLQAKLLRVLESREFFRLGAVRPTRVDVRILAATNRDLRGGEFREDLYYRLSVVTLRCPPLRDRGGDVSLLAERFLDGKALTPAAREALAAYPWPGNVRELRNVCERCALFAEGASVDADDLPLEVRLGDITAAADDRKVPTLKEMERELVVRALAATSGNRTKAAKLLGISYPTLKKKIDDFGV